MFAFSERGIGIQLDEAAGDGVDDEAADVERGDDVDDEVVDVEAADGVVGVVAADEVASSMLRLGISRRLRLRGARGRHGEVVVRLRHR